MFDVTFLIPDYDEWVEPTIPPDPWESMPENEQERLNEELYQLIDSGAYDPEREIPI